MKNLIKKWWFWLIIVVSVLIIGILINQYIENKKLEEKFEKIGEGALDYYEGVQEADGYLDRFTYNYATGEVDYNPNK